MNLTNEQIEQILDGAPDGATHVEILEDEPSEYWLLDSDELLWHWHKNSKDLNRTWRIGIPELPVENIHDLSDLREILILRKLIAELERDNKSLTLKIELIKHKVDIDARKEVLLSVIGRPSTTILAERDAEVARKAFIAGCIYGEKHGIFGRDRQADKYAQRIKDGK